MNELNDVSEAALVVAFSDLTGFARFARNRPDREVFEIMSAYFELAGDIIERGGGRVVKPIGDSVLMTFPEGRADDAVNALLRLKEEGDRWLEQRGLPCRHVIKAHAGPVCCGPIGPRGDKRLDVYGRTVNTAALTRSNGFAVTPQVFRKLAPDTRKRLKKHTPPVTYIPVGERHRSG